MQRKKHINMQSSHIPESINKYLSLGNFPLKSIPSEYQTLLALEDTVSHAFRWPFSSSIDLVTTNPAFQPAHADDPGIALFCVHGTPDGNASFVLITKGLIGNLAKEISNVYQIEVTGQMQGRSIFHYADELEKKIMESGHKKIILAGHARGGVLAALVGERLTQKKTGIEVHGVIPICSPFDGHLVIAAHRTQFQSDVKTLLEQSMLRYLFIVAERDFHVSNENSFVFKDGASLIILPEHGRLSAKTTEKVIEHMQNFILDILPQYEISFEQPRISHLSEGSAMLELEIDENERIILKKGIFYRTRVSLDPHKPELHDEIHKFNRFEVSRLVPYLGHPGLRRAFLLKLQSQSDEIKDFAHMYLDACFKEKDPEKYQLISADFENMNYKFQKQRLKKIANDSSYGKKSRHAAQEVLAETGNFLKCTTTECRDTHLALLTRILQCTAVAIESPRGKANLALYKHYYLTLRKMQYQAFETKSCIEGKLAVLANAMESVVWLRIPSNESPIFDVTIKLVDKFYAKISRERLKLSSQYKKTWSKKVRQNRLDKGMLLERLSQKFEQFKNNYAVNIDNENFVRDFIQQIESMRNELSEIEHAAMVSGICKLDSSATKSLASFLEELNRIESEFVSENEESIVSQIHR